MALRATYSVSASSNVDISARIRAYQLNVVANAEQGSVGGVGGAGAAASRLLVDDPEGGLNIIGHKVFTLTETAESSNQQVILKAISTDRDVSRGIFRVGSARLWDVGLADPNEVITRRIMRGSDANRPAETDVQRVQWLLGTSEFGGIVTTSRYTSTRFPVAMDAVDYRDQSNQQILDDCAQQSGKNYFILWDEPVSAYGLYYDFPGASPYRSSLYLTNILGLVDNDLSFGVVDADTKLNRDPSRVYSGVVLPYVGGEVYVQNDAIANAFVRRDTTAPSVNVKTATAATARANRYIFDASTEADVITTSVILPLAKVNHIKEGMAVRCWFSHFPGYDTGWTWMRVLNRTVVATSEEFYTLTMDLAAAVGGLHAGGGLTSDGTPYPAPAIIAPTPPQSCIGGNGLTYPYTLAGTRTGLGLTLGGDGNYHATSTDFLQYWRLGGGSENDYPLAGTDGDWGNGGVNHCVGTSGGVDYAAGGVAQFASIQLVGPGTLTIKTTGGKNGLCPTASLMSATARASGSSTTIASDSQPPGTDLTIVIPNDGHCSHVVSIAGPTGSWGFVSATWTT